MPTDFGSRVRLARSLAKLTQKELASRVGMSQGALSELESAGFSSTLTVQIAHACGVDVQWLATGDGSPGGLPATTDRQPIPLDNNPDYPAVRRVRIKASAGVNGYAVEHMDEDGPPIVFRADWFRAHGYRPDKLVALRVCGQSMEPSLYEGDLIVVNTQQTEPKDGRVFVVLYEGVVAVKRLVRDAGAWWLESDNADKRAFPRKACTDETTVPVGEVVYKQSERI